MTSFKNTTRHNKKNNLNKDKRKSVKNSNKRVKVFDVNYGNYGLFKEKISSDYSLMLVAYIANWCPHCKELKRNWSQLVNKLKKIRFLWLLFVLLSQLSQLKLCKLSRKFQKLLICLSY